MKEIELLGLLIRNIQFMKSQPEVRDAVIDKTMITDTDGVHLGYMVAMLHDLTFGRLALLWENLPSPVCPECGERTFLAAFGGGPFGQGFFARWFCPECAKIFVTHPKEGMATFWSNAQRASNGEAIQSTDGTNSGESRKTKEETREDRSAKALRILVDFDNKTRETKE